MHDIFVNFFFLQIDYNLGKFPKESIKPAAVESVNQKVIEHPNQSNYMPKQNARIYIPPDIVKKPRKLEN